MSPALWIVFGLLWIVSIRSFSFFAGAHIPATAFVSIPAGLLVLVWISVVFVVAHAARSWQFLWVVAIVLSGGLLAPAYGLVHLREPVSAPLIVVSWLVVLGLLAAFLAAWIQIFDTDFDWGNDRLIEAIESLDNVEAIDAYIGPPNELDSRVSRSELTSLFALISSLSATTDIGDQGPWERFCEVGLETAEQGSFRITLASRPSLSGRVIAIVERNISNSNEQGFYEGDTLMQWLVRLGYCGGSEDSRKPSLHRGPQAWPRSS